MPPFRRPRAAGRRTGPTDRRWTAGSDRGLPARPGAAAVPAVQTPPRPGRSAWADGRRWRGLV